jgi:excisionase family DNA binding protein
MPNEPLFLTIEEVAHRLGMGRTWVYERVLFGDLPSVKLGRARRIPAESVNAFADRITAEQIGEASHSIAG